MLRRKIISLNRRFLNTGTKKILMKSLLLIGVLSSVLPFVQAQLPGADSLKQALGNAKDERAKIRSYLALADAYQYHYPDTSLYFSSKGYPLAEKLNDVKAQIALLCTMEEAYGVKGDFKKSLQSALQALRLSETTGDSALIGQSNNAIGMAYFNAGDYRTALDYYFKVKDNHQVFRYLSPEIIAGLIGRDYYFLNNYDSALFFLRQAYKKEKPWPVPYTFTGAILESKGRYKDALDYYRNGIRFSTLYIDKIVAYNGISGLFEKMGQTDSAIYYAKQVVSAAKLTSLTPQIMDAAKLLTKIYAGKQSTDSAFKYQSILLEARDSLFSQEKVRRFQTISFSEEMRKQDLANAKLEYSNRLRTYTLVGGLIVFLLIVIGLFKNNRNKRKANEILYEKNKEIITQRDNLTTALSELKSTQRQLIQSEKMASLGELTAGIAHQIQNPLNFVNNFSEVSGELIGEMKAELDQGNIEEAKTIADDVKQNLEKINHHGKRADAIVKNMLQHSRTATPKKEPTDINALADQYLRLSYHGMRAKDKSFNCQMMTAFDEALQKVNVVSQDIGRALLNLFNNAFFACAERSRNTDAAQSKERSRDLKPYVPIVSVSTRKEKETILIIVKDNGNGIPDKIQDKIFQPFFTTKPTGAGTGLGLSLGYDIITREHDGTIEVESTVGEGTTFKIQLPL